MKRLTPNTDSLKADPSGRVLSRAGLDQLYLVLPAAARTTIVADQTLGEGTLLVAQWGNLPALVQVSGARVTVRPMPASLTARAASALLWGRAATTLRLSSAARWAIAIHGGISRVTADLRALQLSKLEVNGGASDVQLDLPRPVGVVHLRFAAGIHGVTLRRPQGVPVRVVLSEGGSQLALDGQYLHATPGPIQLGLSPQTAPDYYVVQVAGGARRLIVETQESAQLN